MTVLRIVIDTLSFVHFVEQLEQVVLFIGIDAVAGVDDARLKYIVI